MKSKAWGLLIDRQRESGLTVSEFCRNEGISTGSFRYWRKKFVGSVFSEAREQKMFTELILPESTRRVELYFPGDVRVILDGEVDALWLRQLLTGNV
jgi:transposase-like protein